MPAILVATLIALSANGYGAVTLRRLGTLPSSRLERFVLSSLVGAGILTFVVLGIGLVGALTAALVWGIVLVGLTLTAIELRSAKAMMILDSLGKLWAARRNGDILTWGCWLFLALSALLNLLAALAPISGTDALAYHLAIPKLYAEEGRVRYMPGVYYSTAAFGIEMLFTLAIVLGSSIAAQVLHFSFGVAAAVVVYALAARTFSRRAALLAATLFYAITDVSVQSSVALVDLGAAAYLLAAVLAALRWREQAGRWYLVAALLAGFHAGTKMPNLVAAGALWLAMAVDVLVRRNVALAWRPLGVAGALMLLVAAPWFARSWAWTGNPVYPYFNSFFHGRDFSIEASERQLAIQYYKTIGDRSLDRLMLAPFSLTVTPDVFRSGYLGPIFLATMPFVWLVPISRGARLLMLFALLSLPSWFFLYPRLRTLLPALGALAGPAAAAFLALTRLHPLTRALTIVSLTLWLLTSLAANGRYHLPTLSVALGLESQDSFLRRRLPQPDSQFLWYDDFMNVNRLLPSDATVLLWDTRGYYLERRYIWANSVAQGLIPADQQTDSVTLVQALKGLGVSHVAMFPGDAPTTSDVPIERLQHILMVSGRLQPIYQSQTMVLSELR